MRYNFSTDMTLKRIQHIILKAVSPNKIILFGSRARGDISANSDYDILVIKDDIKNERKITKQINYQLLNEDIKYNIDILAISTEKWTKNQNNIAYIYKNINSEGIVLYE